MVTKPTPLVARLYFDEDADTRLAAALRQRGYDVETTVEAGLLEASDEEQLAYAVSRQRALVTHNIRHFPGVHTAWVEAGREHWGIIILIGHSSIGAWLRRMETLLNRFLAEELQNVGKRHDVYTGRAAESLLSRGVAEPLAVPWR